MFTEANSVEGFICLLRLTDQRKRRGDGCAMAVILMALVLARLAGQDTPAGIAEWVQRR